MYDLSGRQVLETALNALHHTTGLRARKIPGTAPRSREPTLSLKLKQIHRQHQFLVVVKNVDRFQLRDRQSSSGKLAEADITGAPYITRETAERAGICISPH